MLEIFLESQEHTILRKKEIAYASLTPSGQESFYTLSTVTEKCEGCYNYTRCCESNCEVFEDKVAMEIENPCQFCSYDSPSCYAAKEINDSSEYRPTIKEFQVKTLDGRVWSYNEIDKLLDAQLKLLIGMRFINKYLRLIGREDLLFKFKQTKGCYQIRFLGAKYSFSGNLPALAVLEKAWPYTHK